MSVLFDLYKLKVKLFLGAFRVSKTSMVILAVYALGMIPGTIGVSTAVVKLVNEGADLTVHLEALSAIISGFLAFILLSTFRGITAFEYEQSLIFTSPITPRRFLIASLLAEITVFSLSFFFPVFVFFGIIIVSLGLSIISVLSMVIFILSFIFFLVFLKSSLSILGSDYRNSKIKIVTTVLIVLLLLPAIGLFTRFPVRYRELPYPSTLLAQSFLDIFYNKLPSTRSFLVLASYLLASLALFLFSSKKNFFQFASSVPFVSPFDTSTRMQTIKLDKNIRFFSRAGLGITLDLKSESLLKFLMKKEFIRMIRDGSLFAVLLFYGIASIMTVAGGSRGMPFPIWIFLLALYSFIVPLMLISNWRITELDNLWIPLTSGVNLGYVVKSLLYDLTLIAFAIPVAAIVFLNLISQIDPLMPLVLVASVSMIGSSTNLFVVVHFLGKKRKATPSLMINWVSMLLSGLLMAPTYIYVTFSLFLGFSAQINLLLSIPVLVYSILIFIYFSKKLEKKALMIEM